MRLTLFLAVIAACLAPSAVVAAEKARKSDKALARDLKRCAPATYAAALDCLDTILPAPSQSALAAPDGAVDAHFGLGMFIRNEWGLWREGALYQEMNQLGFTHPDDMSGAILEGFAARERGEPYRPIPPDPALVKAQWEQAVNEGRAGSFRCDPPPRPTKKMSTGKQAVADFRACLDQMAKSLEEDQK